MHFFKSFKYLHRAKPQPQLQLFYTLSSLILNIMQIHFFQTYFFQNNFYGSNMFFKTVFVGTIVFYVSGGVNGDGQLTFGLCSHKERNGLTPLQLEGLRGEYSC